MRLALLLGLDAIDGMAQGAGGCRNSECCQPLADLGVAQARLARGLDGGHLGANQACQ